MGNNIIIFSLLLVLSGCATTDPVIKVEIQRVEVPIPVPCKTEEPTKPDFNFDKLSENDDIFVKIRAMLADRKLHIGYEEQLSAALKSCK